MVITSTEVETDGDQAFSITSILHQPPPMSPDQLYILSTIDPPDVTRMLDDYPNASSHTVVFNNLTPGTTYTYIIRVVLRNDSSITIGLPVTGSFSVPGEK